MRIFRRISQASPPAAPQTGFTSSAAAGIPRGYCWEPTAARGPCRCCWTTPPPPTATVPSEPTYTPCCPPGAFTPWSFRNRSLRLTPPICAKWAFGRRTALTSRSWADTNERHRTNMRRRLFVSFQRRKLGGYLEKCGFPHPNPSRIPAQQVRFEEEKQNRCALNLKTSRSKRYHACSDLSYVDKKDAPFNSAPTNRSAAESTVDTSDIQHPKYPGIVL